MDVQHVFIVYICTVHSVHAIVRGFLRVTLSSLLLSCRHGYHSSTISCTQIFDMLLNGDTYPYPSYYKNVTGSDNYDNILRCEVGTEGGVWGYAYNSLLIC